MLVSDSRKAKLNYGWMFKARHVGVLFEITKADKMNKIPNAKRNQLTK
jgi:hypothetical protein